MQEHDTFPGKVYAVTCASGCTITDNKGRTLGECEAGKQAVVVATSDKLVTSADALVTATFNSAPAALMALGLLGGGASTPALPPGYLAAAFLENHVPVAIRVPVNKPLAGYSFEQCHAYASDETGGEAAETSGTSMRVQIGEWNRANLFVWVVRSQAGGSYLPDTKKTMRVDVADGGAKVYLDNAFLFEQTGEMAGTVTAFNLFSRNASECFAGKKYWVKMKHNGEMIRDLVPCISPDGKPAFYDRVSKKHYSASNTESYIAGMTLSQALKLANLPATGGSLTISLPTGYDSDTGVMAALETARAKGWPLTIRTYTPEAAAAAATTFALRRIWVRRTQTENGAHVAADGTRWQVDWCVDMLTPDGSTPDEHGYELFRSVDAAVSYWELEPWVDPEQEELLTAYNENE